MIFRLSIVASLFACASGFSVYQQSIPNGDRVVDPNGDRAMGVGHDRISGGGSLNPFGEDFKTAGYKWTKELCEKDSDCDGFTNGQELGDPNCIWQEGDTPTHTMGITHPGVSDLERDESGGQLDTCAEFDFNSLPSNYMTNEFLMKPFEVPSKQTTYAKWAIQLDNVEDAYAVKFEPYLDQDELVHHMLLYSCGENSDYLANLSEPIETDAMPCTDLVYAWAIGGKSMCLPDKVGMDLMTSKPWYVLEIHYDNPRGLTGKVDASGIKVTSVPKSAVSGQGYQSAGYLWAGSDLPNMKIPAGRSAFQISAECTYNKLPSSGVTVFSYFLHGHQILKKIWTEVERPGQETFDLACNGKYDFDLQETVAYKEPKKLYPSDILTTHCVYDSSERTSVTNGGDASDDEMCIAFYLYYPKLSNGDMCLDENTKHNSGDGSHVCSASDMCKGDDDYNNNNKRLKSFQNLAKFIQIHIVSMYLSWGILLPIGAIIPLAFKNSFKAKDTWFKVHQIMQTTGVIFMCTGCAVVFINALTHFDSSHKVLGLIVFVMAVLQTLNGFMRPKAVQEKKSKSRLLWETVHRYVGRSTLLLAWVNMYMGITYLEDMYSLNPTGTKILIGVQSVLIAIITLAALSKLTIFRDQSRDEKDEKEQEVSSTMKTNAV
ncbi:hypothetical protein CTEN210_06444 [Chaetoceros tenuissimus]|uniref:Cytochrome b561 domain-containing protein n=1 Tax=Chaetoceros tenuissimus TaxID=426638 RepID=A0AAD3H4Q9_9STRA|nr:hypothetical protein CTEN210_06444 [Chaetoceros tenuissimus]